MGTITTELRLTQALRYRMPPVMQFAFNAGDNVCIFLERDNRWCCPLKVFCARGMQVTETNRITVKTFGISQVIPADAQGIDRDLKQLLAGINCYMQGYVAGVFIR